MFEKHLKLNKQICTVLNQSISLRMSHSHRSSFVGGLTTRPLLVVMGDPVLGLLALFGDEMGGSAKLLSSVCILVSPVAVVSQVEV